jgi:membrane-bound metal-dependent hydrolase YbcI (DUF457 family)
MDIFTHALVGAATGAAFDRPVAGALYAVMPDLVLGSLKRRRLPTPAYNVSHSLAALLAVTVAAYLYPAPFGGARIAACAFFCYLSHLILDAATHGPQWAPMLLWPVRIRFSGGDEWEWFNTSWFKGFALSLLWSILWLQLSLFHIGFRY